MTSINQSFDNSEGVKPGHFTLHAVLNLGIWEFITGGNTASQTPAPDPAKSPSWQQDATRDDLWYWWYLGRLQVLVCLCQRSSTLELVVVLQTMCQFPFLRLGLGHTKGSNVSMASSTHHRPNVPLFILDKGRRDRIIWIWWSNSVSFKLNRCESRLLRVHQLKGPICLLLKAARSLLSLSDVVHIHFQKGTSLVSLRLRPILSKSLFPTSFGKRHKSSTTEDQNPDESCQTYIIEPFFNWVSRLHNFAPDPLSTFLEGRPLHVCKTTWSVW